MKDLNKIARKELLSLPLRKWDKVSRYQSLIVFSEGQKHDSGWALMYIIGVDKSGPKEIAVTCTDDIMWVTNGNNLRTDCCLKSRAIHFWSNDGVFEVGSALSSVTVKLI